MHMMNKHPDEHLDMQAITKELKPKQETKPIVKEVRAVSEKEFCPGCFKKDQAAELAKRDHQHSLEKLEAERDTAKQQLEAVANAHTSPTEELFQHWETCPNCKPKLDGLVGERYIKPAYQKGQESPTMDGIKAKLASMGWLPPMSKITIKEEGDR